MATISEDYSTGLVSAWLTDSSGLTTDLHGSNNLTNTGVTLTTGVQGDAGDFEASESDFLSVADTADLSFSDTFSLAAWVNFESTSGNMAIAAKFVATGNQRSYIFRWKQSTSELQLLTYTNGTTIGCNEVVSWSPSTATDYHVAVTKNGTSVKFYVDGSQQGATQTGTNGTVYDGTADFTIGQYDSSNYIDGVVNQVLAYNTEISSAYVSGIYNGGAGVAYAEGGFIPKVMMY